MDTSAYFNDVVDDGRSTAFTSTSNYMVTQNVWAPSQIPLSAGSYFYPQDDGEEDRGHTHTRANSSATASDTRMSSRASSSSHAASQKSSKTSRSSKSSKSSAPRLESPPAQGKGKSKGRKVKEEVVVDDDEAKRNKVLERNRLAASKCRQKKKEWVSELEETKFGLEHTHSNLQLEYNALVGEVSRMKSQLMSHASCNDHNIDKWLENEARKFVNNQSHRSHSVYANYGEAVSAEEVNAAYQNSVFADPRSMLQRSPTGSDYSQMPSPRNRSLTEMNYDHMPDSIFEAHEGEEVGG